MIVTPEKVKDCLAKEHYADAYGFLSAPLFDCNDCNIKEARVIVT